MSIPITGSLSRSGGLLSAISKNAKLLNLKGVKRITVTFDPFGENVKQTREVIFQLSLAKVVRTNPRCIVRTNVVCDRSDPKFIVDLIPEVHEAAGFNTVKFNARHLSALEILELFNKHITTLAPKEEEVKILSTKSTKKKKK
ncbi:uncharacterized protein LOC129575605 [Sitodiplosis mosellana]|uniref:uncharacterized protein LOC129575605 n=1 Tax=Sitodiplosis mosellana TaxID=263140 RepID=UPI0024442FC4|nr:uncharacterized protein LOC129575605 [Sitodiplosis mosellana]